MKEITTYDNERRYIFNNWSNEDFTATWGGVPQIIKAGQTIELPQYKAYHYTKHFVDREMMKDNKAVSMGSSDARKEYELKTVTEITGGIDSPALDSIKEKIRVELEAEMKSEGLEVKEEVVEVKEEIAASGAPSVAKKTTKKATKESTEFEGAN